MKLREVDIQRLREHLEDFYQAMEIARVPYAATIADAAAKAAVEAQRQAYSQHGESI